MDSSTLATFLGALLLAASGGFGLLFRSLLAAQQGRIARAEKVADEQAAVVKELTSAVNAAVAELRRERGRER